MKRLVLSCLFVAANQSFAAPAWAAEGAADAVRAIYVSYQAAETSGGMGPDQLNRKLYTPRVRRQITQLEIACRGKDMCLPDADFLIAGQDFKITDLKIVTRSQAPMQASVEATFRNFDTQVRRVFSLREIEGRWLIDDIDFGGGRRLKDELKPVM